MKFIRRDYTAFVGIPNTRAGIQDFMCSEIADMIVSSDTGWEYDTRTPNKEAFIRIPTTYSGDSSPFPVLYLRNTVSDCKLMIVSILAGNTSYVNGEAVSRNIFQKGKGNSASHKTTGIGLSIIPPGVSDEYPDSFDENTEFGTNTFPVVCENVGTTSSGQVPTSSVGGVEYYINFGDGTPVGSYGVSVDEYSVTLFGGMGTQTRGQMYPIFTLGKVLGTLSYDTEIVSQCYGTVRYYNVTKATFDEITEQFTIWGVSGIKFTGYVPTTTSGPRYSQFLCQCNQQDGTIIDCYYSMSSYYTMSPAFTNSQSPDYIRWTPGIVWRNMNSSFGALYEGGDGFKGYLDTNLIRYAIANKGQLFNNGQFCCVADNLLLKWDPDATDTILA